MKQTCPTSMLSRPTDLPTSSWQKILVKAGLRCQICHASGRLLCHTRLDGDLERNALALCKDCYKLAQIGKRKNMYSRIVHLFHFACLITLSLATFVMIALLTYRLPLLLLLLCVGCIYAVLLLERLSKHWF